MPSPRISSEMNRRQSTDIPTIEASTSGGERRLSTSAAKRLPDSAVQGLLKERRACGFKAATSRPRRVLNKLLGAVGARADHLKARDFVNFVAAGKGKAAEELQSPSDGDGWEILSRRTLSGAEARIEVQCDGSEIVSARAAQPKPPQAGAAGPSAATRGRPPFHARYDAQFPDFVRTEKLEELRKDLEKAADDLGGKREDWFKPVEPYGFLAKREITDRLGTKVYAAEQILKYVLAGDAQTHLGAAVLPPRPPMPPLGTRPSADRLARAMLEAAGDSKGLIIAERHKHLAPKRLLIDQMASLKRAGVDVLYLEFMSGERDQTLLDSYFDSPAGTPMPATLRKELDGLALRLMGRVFSKDEQPGADYAGVVMAAKAAGVRPVGLECMASRDTTYPPDRRSALNFMLAKTIEHHRAQPDAGGWVALMGDAHANTVRGVVGCAELTGTLSLQAFDSNDVKTPKLSLRPNNLNCDACYFMPS